MIKEAARLISEARRPVIYAGGGILKSRAAEALRELAERTDIPVVTTLMARGAFPDDHPLCLGMPGMHGNYTAITAMQQADLLIALGTRFDDRVTGKVVDFAPEAKIIHVDIDPAELGKIRRPDVPIVGDCRQVITEIVRALEGIEPAGSRRVAQPHLRLAGALPAALRPAGRRRRPQASVRHGGAARLRPGRDDPGRRASASTRCGPASTGASPSPTPGSTPAASAPWASAVPAAIGAKVGRPDRTVWAVDGDGCFQMTAQELVTASSERIPIKVAILNNAYLGMVRQWQEMFYEERYSEVYLSPDLPDYVKWAEAMGCVGLPGGVARGGGPDHREGQRHRRPAGRDRLPHRRPGEGVPDGAGRSVQRRRRRAPVPEARR